MTRLPFSCSSCSCATGIFSNSVVFPACCHFPFSAHVKHSTVRFVCCRPLVSLFSGLPFFRRAPVQNSELCDAFLFRARIYFGRALPRLAVRAIISSGRLSARHANFVPVDCARGTFHGKLLFRKHIVNYARAVFLGTEITPLTSLNLDYFFEIPSSNGGKVCKQVCLDVVIWCVKLKIKNNGFNREK